MLKLWDNFWFKAIDPRQYAVLRIAFGCLSTVYFLELWPYVPAQFSNAGWLPGMRPLDKFNGGTWSLFYVDAGQFSVEYARIMTGIGIISAILLTLGWHSRIAALVNWLVWVSLWNRNPLLLDGDDAILKTMCFYLMLSPCGKAWSIDAVNQGGKIDHVSSWPLRLIQFQIALIYFVSGWVKFHNAEWDNGTILNYILIHPHYSRWDGWLIQDNPIIQTLLASLAQAIRWWELLFPLLLLSSRTRTISLLLGVLFHLGLFLTMNLRWFPWLMLALYPALISTWTFPFYADKLTNYCMTNFKPIIIKTEANTGRR